MEIEVQGDRRIKAMNAPSGSKGERRGEVKERLSQGKEAIVTVCMYMHIVLTCSNWLKIMLTVACPQCAWTIQARLGCSWHH